MLKPIVIAFALASSPAFASSHYHAQPAAKPEATKLVLRDTVWKCGDAGCAATKSNSRPGIVCALLVKKVGSLKSFTVGGAALAAPELEKCNARAE
jgi:hypothetical protein